jgi:hypothetical protein
MKKILYAHNHNSQSRNSMPTTFLMHKPFVWLWKQIWKGCLFQATIMAFAICMAGWAGADAQSLPDQDSLFRGVDPLAITLRADFKRLKNEKFRKNLKERTLPAAISISAPGGTMFHDSMSLRARGNMRREICNMPPMQLNFGPAADPVLRRWGTLKLVCGCATTEYDEQLVLKEYLAYQIYNLITDKSFRVRLARITYEPVSGKAKPYTQYAFLIEDTDDMARRNGCIEIKDTVVPTTRTDRWHATLFGLFQYMIGNTDYEIQKYHNIKLIRSLQDTNAAPIPVPYDFDYSGFVDARYAVPAPAFGTTSVTERVYRGFQRTPQELEAALSVFMAAKPTVDSLLRNFPPLADGSRKDALKYISRFYEIAEDPKTAKRIFLDEARTQ